MILYKDYPNEFINYVNGLIKHNVTLTDLRLKQICKKWDIGITNCDGGYWVNAELDDNLRKHINILIMLIK
jgi:hypothetical protein